MFTLRTGLSNIQSPKEVEKVLNNHCYDLISHGHYGLAEGLLEFGLKLPRYFDEKVKMMMEVNLANAKMLRGNEEGAMASLAVRDWKTTSSEFEISVAAISKDAERVAELIERFHPEEISPEWCLRHWPVFAHVRESKDFRDAYLDRFGAEYTPAFEVDMPSTGEG